ncbi:enoyl-CoA hydratase/isomerase family protein [Pseudomaricurvus sp.]|uniref:enoyl-CoA hydratase/isomerase family protein n=1 Tax=Pseudomaricurvus sp. TaxID=2004510 RepID=UPI003F6D5F89
MSEAPHLLVEENGAVIVCTLNRPEKLNALTGQTMRLFEEALHKFRDTAELKVMLIRATGRFFCAGADLRDKTGEPEAPANTATAIREKHRLRLHGMHRIYDEMEHIEKPIVVAHQGTCVGGGLELSLSCDFRLAAKSASYAFPEGKFGVLPASNGVSRLTRYVGPHWARYLIMANKPADADRAYTMGLVHEVYPDETFDADAMEFCEHLAKQNSEQMGAAKVAIEMAHELGRDQARHVERMANSALMLNPDYLAMMEKYVSNIGSKGKS